MTQIEKVRDNDPVQDASDEAMRGFIGYSLKRAYLVIHHAATGALEEFGLKVRSFSALSLIVTNPGVTPSRLAEMLRIERSNVVLLIDELETRELISRTRDGSDRRRYALNPTLRGQHLQEKAARAVGNAENRLASRLTAAEQTQLAALLHRLEDGTAG
jgi:DNA-binding MarR family transcriptional regulator